MSGFQLRVIRDAKLDSSVGISGNSLKNKLAWFMNIRQIVRKRASVPTTRRYDTAPPQAVSKPAGRLSMSADTILPHMRYHYGSSRNRGSAIESNGR